MKTFKGLSLKTEWGAPCNEEFTQSDGWTCKLVYQKRQYTFPFYKGYGHGGAEPELKEVLDCLFMDASCADGTFEDFCADFDYDTDSRRAERIYKACQASAKALRRVLAEDFDAIREWAQD